MVGRDDWATILGREDDVVQKVGVGVRHFGSPQAAARFAGWSHFGVAPGAHAQALRWRLLRRLALFMLLALSGTRVTQLDWQVYPEVPAKM